MKQVGSLHQLIVKSMPALVAKALALRSDGNSQIRVVCDEKEHIIATYLVTKRLIVSTANGLFTEEIVLGLETSTVSEI